MAANNPFRVPEDEEVFALRDEEAARKRAEKEKLKTQHVWEKGVKVKASAGGDKGLGIEEALGSSGGASAGSSISPTATAARRRRTWPTSSRRSARCSSCRCRSARSAEIRKLEERAQQREEALRKSEQMLDEDAMRFDQFLKDNDQKAVQAIKRAEAETKQKAEKVQEIKKLNMQITQIKSEMSKFEEQLEDCRKYKDFLDKLTPPEWFEEQEQLRQGRRRGKERKMAVRQEELNAQAEVARAEAEKKAEEERAKNKRRSRKEREAEEAAAAAQRASIKAKVLTLDDVSSDEDPEEEREMPMYFTRPQQLLDIFTDLEESNLFLIQNSQETESALEELKTKFADTRAKMDADSVALEAQIEALRASIALEEDKGKALLERAGRHEGVQAQEQTLEELNRKVAEVYRAIFAEADHSLGTLQMLTNIEARLEDLLTIILGMPPEVVEAAEKQKEKERRQRVRELKQEQMARAQEERIQRSIRRAQEPVKRRTGKPEMFRSVLVVKKKKVVDLDANKLNEEDDVNFYLKME